MSQIRPLEAVRGLVEAIEALPEFECKNVGNFQTPHCPSCGLLDALTQVKKELNL